MLAFWLCAVSQCAITLAFNTVTVSGSSVLDILNRTTVKAEEVEEATLDGEGHMVAEDPGRSESHNASFAEKTRATPQTTFPGQRRQDP